MAGSNVNSIEFVMATLLEEDIYQNYLFLGEAGSGKSEIALNFAVKMKKLTDKEVHFFDMDMTKPLFRSRDIAQQMEASGIIFHYEEQFMDAPTLVGGVNRLFKDPNSIVVMDVGGDDIGARSVGGFAPAIRKQNTMVYYVLNAFRPWSYDIDHIDETLGKILNVTHLPLEKVKLISNPNVGKDTTAEDVLSGHDKMSEMVNPYKPIEFMCAREDVFDEVKKKAPLSCMPLHLYLTYPWEVV